MNSEYFDKCKYSVREALQITDNYQTSHYKYLTRISYATRDCSFFAKQPSQPYTTITAATAQLSISEMLGQGHRRKVTPVTLKHFVIKTVATELVSLETSSRVLYPIVDYLDDTKFSEIH